MPGPASLRRAGATPAFAAVALVAAVLAGCGAVDRGPRATRGTIVISIDTLRADHLGLYGYPQPTSPFLDSLAQRSTVFDEAYASFPSTLTSHMTLFTGLLPREHGVYPPDGRLAESIPTFPEIFHQAGYRTFAVTEGGFVSPRFGFKRGFETYAVRDRNGERQVAGTFDRALAIVRQLGPEERFLLFVHTYATHAPYDAAEEYERPFWQGPPPPDAIAPSAIGLTRVSERGDTLSPAALAWLTARYDAGVLEVDTLLAKFFAGLQTLGVEDDVTIVVTSDHGEELLEHGKLHHSQLYREVMRVPLMVLHPDRREPVRQSGIVGLVDLAPTLLELAGLEQPPGISGTSLVPLLGRPDTAAPATAYLESGDGTRALYRGRHGALESLHLFDVPPGTWINRRLPLDVAAGPLRLEARAFAGSREIAVHHEGALLATATVGTEWGPVTAMVATAAQRTRIELAADDCTEEGAGRTFACHGFQVRGAPTTRLELFDVAADPAQRHDLALERPRDARRLLRDLMAFKPEPRAPGATAVIDPELEKRLESLGYLD